MPFDMGFDFRANAVLVTDPAYAVPVLAEAYPHLYTNANGDSIIAGWTTAFITKVDRDAAFGARLAGINYTDPNQTCIFQIDLASGSAPGAGLYTLDGAFGDRDPNTPSCYIKDNTTILAGVGILDGANGANQWYDVTGVLRTSVADWVANHVTANKIFSSTTVNLENNPAGHRAGYSTISHFRLTLVPPVSGRGRLLSSERNRLVRSY